MGIFLAVATFQRVHIRRICILGKVFFVLFIVAVTIRTPTQAEVKEIEYLKVCRQRSDQTFTVLCIFVLILLPHQVFNDVIAVS